MAFPVAVCKGAAGAEGWCQTCRATYEFTGGIFRVAFAAQAGRAGHRAASAHSGRARTAAGFALRLVCVWLRLSLKKYFKYDTVNNRIILYEVV